MELASVQIIAMIIAFFVVLLIGFIILVVKGDWDMIKGLALLVSIYGGSIVLLIVTYYIIMKILV